MVTLGIVIGLLLVAVGLFMIVLALPITHRLARMLPQWQLNRGDTDRLGSTTFLMASLGMLMTITGAAVIAMSLLPD
ncbi:MAG: hypothetical protein ABFR95_03830 [Actinomycetota bacterium]